MCKANHFAEHYSYSEKGAASRADFFHVIGRQNKQALRVRSGAAE